jgi:hypothetical protein
MAWPGQRGQLSAKEILGMEPDELKNKLESAATKEDVTATKTKLEGIEGTLAALQASLAKLTAPPPETPDPNIKLDADDPTTQMLTDPAGYVNRQTAGTQAIALQARADVLEMRARSEYPGAFAQYGEALMSSAKNFNIASRAQEGFWASHIRMVMGDKLVKGELVSGSYPSLMGASSFAPSNGGDSSDPNKGFNPDMAKFFKERNVPLEQAAKLKKLMVDNGEPISMENYKGQVGNA